MSGPLARSLPLFPASNLDLHNVEATEVEYRGRRAVRLVEAAGGQGGEPLAIVPGTAFGDGVIEAEIAGVPRGEALEYSRGFVGLAFRVQPGGAAYECIFLRPTNGRADDQLRRNHTTQYMAVPEYPWNRLRQEHPGVYESYVDLEPGAWTTIKLVVAGERALLYVHGAAQPCLVVNDLKLGTTQGQIALWVGSGSDAYFASVAVR